MKGAEALESGIKKLTVEALALEDVDPQQLESDAELFGAGLELDSFDARERHDARGARRVSIEDEPQGQIFASVRSLADFVRTQAGEPGGGKY